MMICTQAYTYEFYEIRPRYVQMKGGRNMRVEGVMIQWAWEAEKNMVRLS